MVKKTIPQLQEIAVIADNAFFVVDSGSVTKKISKANIKRNLKQAVRHESVTSLTMTTDDDTVIFDTPDAPGVMDAYLPAVADSSGKVLRLHNNGTGALEIYPIDVGATINGAAFLDLGEQNKAATLVCDGSDWFIFS